MSYSEARQPGHSLLSGPAIVGYLAGTKFLLHLLTAANYGLFTDELYFLACGEHLAWGYVDMPPLTAAQAWLVRHLLGDSPYAIRLLPALAGAALVVMAGAMVRQMGGDRYAQALVALAVLVAPGWLAIDAYLSMNSIELLLVAAFAMIVIQIIKSGSTQLWVAFGAVAGIGLLNKHTVILFGFALIFAVIVTPGRRIKFNRWFLAGGALALVIFLPNLVWM